MNNKPTFKISRLSRAIGQGLAMMALYSGWHVSASYAADAPADGEQKVEVIQVYGRLQSAASEAMEERREAPVVADLLGAEQISRAGDSDAAAALRRITGLTLRDGKFVYVRGLGERYSSTTLNGAQVPTPDPTRSVIPLDMFPASIIESMAVQKGFSADRPAAFGGGAIDIRTKSIPEDFQFNINVGSTYNTNNDDDGLRYHGGGDDWRGHDDGTRREPGALTQAEAQYGGVTVNDLFLGSGRSYTQSQQLNRELALSLNRDMAIKSSSVEPGYKLNGSIGNSFTVGSSGDARFGFMAAAAYKRERENYQRSERNYAQSTDSLQVNQTSEATGTTDTVKWSGLFNAGFEWDENNRIETSSIVLHNTEDDARISITEDLDTMDDDSALERYRIYYQERELTSNQIRGKHFFPTFNQAELDWQYTDAKASRKAPNELDYVYNVTLDDQGKVTNRSVARRANSAVYQFNELKDDTENYSIDVKLPVFTGDHAIKLIGGYNYFERARTSFTDRFAFNTANYQVDALDGSYDQVFSDERILDPANGFSLIDTTSDADDYVAAQQLDAGYLTIDYNYIDQWKVSLGARYEDFRQVSLALDPDTGEVLGGDEQIADYAIAQDDVFGSLAITWVMNDEMQLRFNVGQTIVRPDLREVTPVQFIDPETDYQVRGNAELKSSDIMNYDLRWEWYRQNGNNLSIGVFYKDLDQPIETVQLNSVSNQRLLSFRNADSGKLYGAEIEFLQNFDFIASDSEIWNAFYLAGNVTLSDSEVNIKRDDKISLTHYSRKMTGHSPYVVNLQLGFDSPDGQHSATLVYNVADERIAFAGINGLDDVYEQPFHSLDLTYSYYPTLNTEVKFKAKNILGEKSEYEQQGYQVLEKDPGTAFSLDFSYKY